MKKRFLTAVMALALCLGLAVPALAADAVTCYLTIGAERASVSVSAADSGSSTFSLTGEGLKQTGTFDHQSSWGTTPVFTATGPVTVTLTGGYTDGKTLSGTDEKGNPVIYSEIMYIGVNRLSYDAAANKYTTVDEDIVDFDGTYALDLWEEGRVQKNAGTLRQLKETIGEMEDCPMIYQGAVGTISKPGVYYVYVDRPSLRECDAFIHITDGGFTDVPDWCAAAVDWAVGQVITNGTNDGANGQPKTFSPNEKCTQNQILTFLYRAVRNDGTASAEDLEKAVAWAANEGIIDAASFDPGKACTRATAMSYIWQVFDSPDADAEAAGFTDVDAGADCAAAVAWAVENGVTNGTNDGTNGLPKTFGPDETCTRGQIVTFLHRAYVKEARLSVK